MAIPLSSPLNSSTNVMPAGNVGFSTSIVVVTVVVSLLQAVSGSNKISAISFFTSLILDDGNQLARVAHVKLFTCCGVVIAGVVNPDCTAEKAAKSAATKAVVGVGGRCDPKEAAKDTAGLDDRDGVLDRDDKKKGKDKNKNKKKR